VVHRSREPPALRVPSTPGCSCDTGCSPRKARGTPRRLSSCGWLLRHFHIILRLPHSPRHHALSGLATSTGFSLAMSGNQRQCRFEVILSRRTHALEFRGGVTAACGVLRRTRCLALAARGGRVPGARRSAGAGSSFFFLSPYPRAVSLFALCCRWFSETGRLNRDCGHRNGDSCGLSPWCHLGRPVASGTHHAGHASNFEAPAQLNRSDCPCNRKYKTCEEEA
jgi:hypothetical protein